MDLPVGIYPTHHGRRIPGMTGEAHDHTIHTLSEDEDETFEDREEAHNHAIQAPPEDEDETSDSALGDDGILSEMTCSLISLIYEYPVENGRTYHAFGNSSYWGPNDEKAQEHLDFAHHLFTKTLNGKLYLAPISPNIKKALDLGTGTGIWAIDFADEFINCEIIGTDLSPIQPRWVPPNCKFEMDDFNDEWTFGEKTFDFIHIRTTHASVHNRTKFYAQCFRALKPGGYLEEVEYSLQFTCEDESILMDGAISQWNQIMDDIAHDLPKDELYIFRRMKGYIEQAGFERVRENQYRWPLGEWPEDKVLKELGGCARIHVVIGLENLVLRLLTKLGWTIEAITALCAGVRKELCTPSVHPIQLMNIVYGQKPESSELHLT